MKSSIKYILLILVPIAIELLFTFTKPVDRIGNYQLKLIFAIALFIFFVIVNPLYVIILTKHYLVKHSIHLMLSIGVMAVFGIGNVLILNWGLLGGQWDFKNEIILSVELFMISSILLVGILYFAYLRLKGRI